MSSLAAVADVVIVGGGVIGTSVAFHLAEAGVARPAPAHRGALERFALGGGRALRGRIASAVAPLEGDGGSQCQRHDERKRDRSR